MRHTEHFTVRSFDEDVFGNLSMTALLQYLQESAMLQLEKTDQSPSLLRLKDKAYVVSRMNASVYLPVHQGDDIEVVTWLHDCKGVSFNRYFKVLKDGRLIAEAASIWALIGISDRRIYRISDPDIDYTVHLDEGSVGIDLPSRLHMPEDMTLLGERPVYFSDCDINGHINNAKYPELLLSVLTEGKSSLTEKIASVKLNFLKEAPLGDELRIYHAEDDGVNYFRTVRKDGTVNLEAEIVLE